MSDGTQESASSGGAPVVSIGMPVWNCRRTLATAIQSVLHQTYPHWELLVVDDGSTDETVEIARRFVDPRVRVLADGHHKKISARLNEAIRASRGEYFARMDGDDVAYPRRLEAQLEYLRAHPNIDVVGSSMLVFFDDLRPRGKRLAPESHEDICRDPANGFWLAHPTFMGKLEWFRRNLYDADMSLIEDQELLLRTYRSSRFANLPKVLYGYREDKVNLGASIEKRMMLLRRQGRHFLSSGQRFQAARAAFVNLSKAAADALCAMFGLTPVLLRRRAATPLSEHELQEWRSIVAMLEE
jgi:glycosyltransferase involved in cell wall biosynthesis